MTLITLVRHGQASFGQQNYDKLSPRGIEQIQWLGTTFQRQQRPVDYVLSGDMQRQQASLCHFLTTFNPGNIPPSTPTMLPANPAFNEFNHELVLYRAGLGISDKMGLLAYLAKHPQPEQAFIQVFSTSLQRWQGGQFDSEYEETWDMFKQRTWQGLQATIALLPKDSHTLIFTSGGVIATLVQQVLGVTDENAQAFIWQIANASLTTLGWQDNRGYLHSFNDYRYLYDCTDDKMPQRPKHGLVTWR